MSYKFFLCTLQKMQHRLQQLRPLKQILQQVRQEIPRILINCSLQEIAYLNVLPGKNFVLKDEKAL